MTRIAAGLLILLSSTAASAFPAPDDELSFKKRGDEEKRWVAHVGEAIVKAAHSNAKKIDLVKYEITEPKLNRKELTIKLEYSGLVTGKKYLADVTVKIDSSDKAAWEVLNIDYSDNNSVIKYDSKRLQELIKKFNK
jgi:hypothetical protein